MSPRIHKRFQGFSASAVSAAALAFTLAASTSAWAADDSATADEAAAGADAADADSGGPIVVNGARTAKEAAQDRLANVPGGGSLVDQDDVLKGRVTTNQDVLAFQPGVYAQAANGGDGLKISVRGSAINRGVNFFRTGILFQFDGLPVTGPGGTPYELFEPLGLQYTEILRGANGFDRGSSYLGGAINYVSRTGRDADLFEGRVEGGSQGYRKGQVSSGGQFGNFDYYISGTYGRRDGYQAQSASKNWGLQGNIGVQITPDIETRFYGRYRKTWNDTPGAITRAELEGADLPATVPRTSPAVPLDNGAGPKSADPLNVLRNAARIQPGSTWLANKTAFDFDKGSSLSIGFVYHDYPIETRTNNLGIWDYTDLSVVVDYIRTDQLFGRESVTKIGLLSTDHINGKHKIVNRFTIDPGTGLANPSNTPAGTLLRDARYDGADRNLYITNTSEPAPGLKVTLGAALLHVVREAKVIYPVVNEPYKQENWDYTARFGLAYEATQDVQLYGNVSRSVEPANDWSYLSVPPAFVGGPANTLARRALDLKYQTAWTAEIGARGESPIFGRWEISAYRAWVKNELLSVIVDEVNRISAESNASPTIHQGVEVGFNTYLWRSKDNPGHNVTTRQSYTYSDFRFRDDAAWGKNQLPSLPEHFYQGELTYNHPSGLYLTADVQAASGYPVDYANSFSTKSYVIFGATAGYSPPDGDWSAFVDFRNIGDKGYAAAVSPIYAAAGLDSRRISPGDGFSVIAGVTVKLK